VPQNPVSGNIRRVSPASCRNHPLWSDTLHYPSVGERSAQCRVTSPPFRLILFVPKAKLGFFTTNA
jgi:hypothetical protein